MLRSLSVALQISLSDLHVNSDRGITCPITRRDTCHDHPPGQSATVIATGGRDDDTSIDAPPRESALHGKCVDAICTTHLFPLGSEARTRIAHGRPIETCDTVFCQRRVRIELGARGISGLPISPSPHLPTGRTCISSTPALIHAATMQCWLLVVGNKWF